MKTLKRILGQIPLYLLLAVLAVIFWGWLFTLRTNVRPEKKLVVYIDCAAVDEAALAERWGADLPEGIKKAEVHPFSYAMFDTGAIKRADLFIVPESTAAGYRDSFLPLPAGTPGTPLLLDGAAYGVRVYDAATGRGAAADLIDYRTAEGKTEDFYLFFGNASAHAAGNPDAVDNAAAQLAGRILAEAGEAPAQALPDGFILGMDVSSLPAEEAAGVKYYNFEGEAQDPLLTFAQNGITHLRVRVWNDPYDENGRGYGGGNCDVRNAALLGARGARYGLKLIVDFHYSDFWADPGKQHAPKAWQGLALQEKCEALYAFTRESLLELAAGGAGITMVQLGNETNGALCGETDWNGVCALMKAGARAVRETLPEALVAVHFTNPERAGAYAQYARTLAEAGVDYDVFASSYYPFWHGSLEDLSAALAGIHYTFGKRVMIMETSYPYTGRDTDFWSNTVGAEAAKNLTHPFTPQGQADAVREAIDAITRTAGGLGAVYWEGTWIAAGGASREENREKWETFGCGWASSFAAEYDPIDAGRYYGGCAVENQAFFDKHGKPLESLRVFSAYRRELP